MERKKLPVGIENFEEFSTENFYYAERKVCLIDSVGSAVLRRLYARTRRVADELFAAP